MPSADARLCAECGAARELCTCSQMEAPHCGACHALLHGATPRRDSEPVEQCRDCGATVTWYAADGTPYCEGHGDKEAAIGVRGGMEVGW